jgi:hypothetical protein
MMLITGVTDDGRLIVDSWGEKYFIDPSNEGFNRCHYQIIEY